MSIDQFREQHQSTESLFDRFKSLSAGEGKVPKIDLFEKDPLVATLALAQGLTELSLKEYIVLRGYNWYVRQVGQNAVPASLSNLYHEVTSAERIQSFGFEVEPRNLALAAIYKQLSAPQE